MAVDRYAALLRPLLQAPSIPAPSDTPSQMLVHLSLLLLRSWAAGPESGVPRIASGGDRGLVPAGTLARHVPRGITLPLEALLSPSVNGGDWTE